MRPFQSPLWRCRIFALNFYERFGVCPIHLFQLGVVKRLTDEVGIDLGQPYRNGMYTL